MKPYSFNIILKYIILASSPFVLIESILSLFDIGTYKFGGAEVHGIFAFILTLMGSLLTTLIFSIFIWFALNFGKWLNDILFNK